MFAFANAIIFYNPDFLCLTETWLREEIPNEALFLKVMPFTDLAEHQKALSQKTWRSSSGGKRQHSI